jgi:hypothetical protein
MIAIALVMIGGFVAAKEAHAQGANPGPLGTGASGPAAKGVGAAEQKAIAEVPAIDVCSFTNPSTWAFGCFYGALGKLIWGVIVPLTGWLLWVVGQALDFALNLQFASDFFKSPAIAAGWTIIRDLCNMVFIFVLIYGGIATILNLQSANLKKVITGVIISALLINFSLYITRAIIDVSNVATAWFVQGVKNVGGGVGVSDSVQGALQLTKLVAGNGNPYTKQDPPPGLSGFVTGIAFVALNLVAIYMFFKVAFIFIGRIISFIFLLVTAPVGFVGGLGIDKLDELSKDWWTELRCQAFMAPMFFLMLYLTLYIVDQVKIFVFSAGAGSIDPVTKGSFSPVNYLMFAIIVMMLLKTLDVAEKSGCKIGNSVAGFLKSSAGLATGTLAVGTIGKAAGALANSQAMQRFAANSFIGEGMMKASQFTAGSSFGASASLAGLKKMGAPMPSNAFKGMDKGYEGLAKKEAENTKKFKESLGKDVEGAINRQTYATRVENRGKNKGILNKVLATGRVTGGGLGGSTLGAMAGGIVGSVAGPVGTVAGAWAGGAIGGLALGRASLTNTSDVKAGKDLVKDSNKEYTKEAGSAAKDAMKKYNEELNKNPEVKGLTDEATRLEKNIQEETSDVTKNLTKELNVLEKEKEAVDKELAAFDEENKTINGVPIDETAFQSQLTKSREKLAEIEKDVANKEEEVEKSYSLELKQTRERLAKVKERYTKIIDDAMEKQIVALEKRGVKLEERNKEGVEKLIDAGKKQKEEEDDEKARKAMEKMMKDEVKEEKPKEEGGGGKEEKK